MKYLKYLKYLIGVLVIIFFFLLLIKPAKRLEVDYPQNLDIGTNMPSLP